MITFTVFVELTSAGSVESIMIMSELRATGNLIEVMQGPAGPLQATFNQVLGRLAN